MNNQFCYRLKPKHYSQIVKLMKNEDYEIPSFHRDLIKVIIKFYENGITLKHIEGRLKGIIAFIKTDIDKMEDPFK